MSDFINSIVEAVKGRIIPPSSPRHPKYAEWKAAQPKKERAKPAKVENPVSVHDLNAAMGASHPDTDAYDHLAKKFPALHNATGKTGSKLMDAMHKAAKSAGHKDYHAFEDSWKKEMSESAELDESAYKNTFKVSGTYKDKDGNVASVSHNVPFAKDSVHAKSLSNATMSKKFVGYKANKATLVKEEVELIEDEHKFENHKYLGTFKTDKGRELILRRNKAMPSQHSIVANNDQYSVVHQGDMASCFRHLKSINAVPQMPAVKEETELQEENGYPKGHTIEAYGVKGMKSTSWRKSFKHADHLNDWAEKNSAEVHGMRELEHTKGESKMNESAKETHEKDASAYKLSNIAAQRVLAKLKDKVQSKSTDTKPVSGELPKQNED